MGGYVLGFQEIDRTQVAVVGGKGAHLGELSRIEGVRVPDGFCVTTDAFRRILADAPSIVDQLDRLSRLNPDDRAALRAHSAEVRRTLEEIVIPDELAAAITGAVAGLGDQAACAVRSSATAEDLPTASFAGQQDTYLNVVGTAEILRHISLCWASLFTERAVTYRLRNDFGHRKVDMAVVVQRMVFPSAAGVLFTADPVTSNRKVSSVEAGYGLGEALVSGLVNSDSYQVRDGEIVAKTVATKLSALHASPGGGTREQPIGPAQQEQPALTDTQVVRLERLGRRIEAHFGRPQDIEWCLADDEFQVVQSRPITTLFPVPEVDDEENHVYVSVGHQQMMTDAMKPLGLSFWQMTTPRPMSEAGGRLFVDVTRILSAPTSRAGFLDMMGKSDPLMGDALRTVLDRDGFLPSVPDDGPGRQISGVEPATIETDPAVVTELIGLSEDSIATVKREIRTKSGSELIDFIQADLQELRRILFDPRSHQVIMAGMQTTWWLNEHLREWLGEKNAADTLTQSVPHNVTSEMGLALLDVADAIRPHPDVVAFLHEVEDEDFLDKLTGLAGGQEARDVIEAYLGKYGMRCVGEIDITRPRWSERPTTLLPLILANVKNFEPGAGERRFEQGRQEALSKEQELLERLRALPDGEEKAEETRRMIERVRTFSGYREYPKYGMVSRYFVYKQALLAEAERLVRDGRLGEREDIFFLRFQELREVVRTGRADDELIRQRKEAFKSYETLTPPRVFTSDGEAVAGTYRRDDLPSGAVVGLPVSAGTVEGRARVVLDLADADLEPGDILITAYTDPSWSPLFVAITGLVTEVGGLMTHGAVIAREYGLPAVVGVERATKTIKDGQRIRVNGTDGYIEIL
ncbi:phosphoenolpyruvate synthase [Amycolatopsis coloradensis]|uniref:Rifampicin phosphotransferase n=1 Tax=Amycolatopsis coloradensis TaxID=76021 RepID=A0A1R0KIS4_9PSEU|nr:rifamycin-inactivating phosphotransferase [Amycolatopsis coloradensis]OLZ45716.1 phosphoenolpyruvate synthase [Amycolatopsis coloradensis]